MIWNVLICESCGRESPGLTGRPRATKLRKLAASTGWTRMEVDGRVRDICQWCSKLDFRALVTRVFRMDDEKLEAKRGEKK